MRNLLNKIVKYPSYLRGAPAKRRHDDLFVVEYPKSGITWLSFILANVMALRRGEGREVTFFNVSHFIPPVRKSRHIPVPRSWPGFRIIKSHEPFNPLYGNVVYLVRDPVSVMRSFFRMQIGLGLYSGELDGFVRHGAYGVQAWRQHVRGWVEKTAADTRMYYLRFEDLRSDPVRTVGMLLDAYGLRVSRDEIEMAVEKSDLDNMRRLEEQRIEMDVRRRVGRFGSGYRFVREGALDASTEMSPDVVSYIRDTTKVEREWFGYD